MGGSAKKVVEKVAKETGYTGSDLDKGAQAVGAKGSEAIEYTKKKGSEVVEGVKRGASGTIAGAEETFKRSDIGRKAAEFQQYVMDRAGVKDPRDQMQQVLDSTTEAVRNKVKKPKQGPGGGQTVGQGGVEGLKGGAQMTQGQRSRIRQSKRKLRIAK